MTDLNGVQASIIAGDRDKTVTLIEQAIAKGIAPEDIIQNALTKAMTVVGEKFEKNEFFIPEMLIAARAMKAGLEILRPLLAGKEVKTLATVVLGTVQGDLHDVGKNLVGIMMEGVGCNVIDLGIDVPPEKFVQAVNTHQPTFLGLSALLSTTMPMMKVTISALEKAGIRDKVKILVGGAPLTQEFADDIGADGYAANAGQAVEKMRQLL